MHTSQTSHLVFWEVARTLRDWKDKILCVKINVLISKDHAAQDRTELKSVQLDNSK